MHGHLNIKLHDNVLPSSTVTTLHSQFVKLTGSHDIARSFNLRCQQKQSGFKNLHIDAGNFSDLYPRSTGLVLQAILPQLAATAICIPSFFHTVTGYELLQALKFRNEHKLNPLAPELFFF